eukprot:TRINITY_DN122788_c0_g1_i1.p1 TRINITY_DN122788_c0_g1~~TRINITY_DN122788_c0_g1_i1.p1  ORF type:complete len:199 (-),score=42.50 TRINITY_DN122788_c0_g1_i1:418-1014(-)
MAPQVDSRSSARNSSPAPRKPAEVTNLEAIARKENTASNADAPKKASALLRASATKGEGWFGTRGGMAESAKLSPRPSYLKKLLGACVVALLVGGLAWLVTVYPISLPELTFELPEVATHAVDFWRRAESYLKESAAMAVELSKTAFNQLVVHVELLPAWALIAVPCVLGLVVLIVCGIMLARRFRKGAKDAKTEKLV